MAKVSKRDMLLYKFLVKDFGDPFKEAVIEPEDQEYAAPDFGFNNELIFEDKGQSLGGYSQYWKYFMDYASPFPRFERVKNYIQFVNEQKFHEESKKLQIATKSP